MGQETTDMHRLQDLVRYHREGRGPREVARLSGMSPSTEQKYRAALKAAGLLAGPAEAPLPEMEVLRAALKKHCPGRPAPRQEVSSVERWRGAIEAMQKLGARPRAIYDRLVLEQKEFSGTYPAVKRLCRRICQERGVLPEDVVIPVSASPPGEIAQVDFGFLGKVYDPGEGKIRKVWVFVLVLSYSRHMVARLCFDQKVSTWLRLHAEAFQELGGVPWRITPDNLKSAVVRAAFGPDGEPEVNRSYREMARSYGFQVEPTPPMAPEKKGKVESGVKYVKRNFYAPRREMDLASLSAALAQWVECTAGARTHGTVQWKPLEVFLSDEKAALKPLPVIPYELVVWKKARVHRDTLIVFDWNFYSVPWRHVGREVWVRSTRTQVSIYQGDVRVRTHNRIAGKGQKSIHTEDLPYGRRELRERSQEHWLMRARQIAPEVERYIGEIFAQDDVLSMLRRVQAVVALLEKHPKGRAVAACERARHYGSYTYQSVRDILRRGLDLEPLRNLSLFSSDGSAAAYRYARDPKEFVSETPAITQEVTDGTA